MARTKFDRDAVGQLFREWKEIPDRDVLVKALNNPVLKRVMALKGPEAELFEWLSRQFDHGAPVLGASEVKRRRRRKEDQEAA